MNSIKQDMVTGSILLVVIIYFKSNTILFPTRPHSISNQTLMDIEHEHACMMLLGHSYALGTV